MNLKVFSTYELMGLDEELLEAAERGDVGRVHELLGRDANPNARDEFGFTPLHWAAFNGHAEVARLLLDRGADVDARSKNGLTPLHLAAFHGHAKVAGLLLDKGADVNAGDVIGGTPLHFAAAGGQLDIARLLLDRGADVNAKTENGLTPLHLASLNGHVDVARLLLERGADASVRDVKGRTPLDRARERGHVEVARVIEEYVRGRSAPSILGVECSGLYAGEWGRLLVRVKGYGKAFLRVEGDVEWIDPGRVALSGESTVEVPVKPKALGELPVKITIKSESGEDARVTWLKVSEKARKCPSCGAPAEPGAKYCWRCGAKVAE